MKCFRIRTLFSAFLDDMTDMHDTEMIKDHLKHCICCERELENLKMCQNILEQMEEPKLPEGFALDLHRRLMKESCKA